MEIINFTKCIEKVCSYGGSEKKKKIIYDGLEFLLKFPDPIREKKMRVSYINNVYSEYIGCKIFKSIGCDVQDVLLGLYEEICDGILKEKVVVACKDFANDNNKLIEFSSISNSITSVSKKFTTTIEDVYKVIDSINYDCDKDLIKNKFWDMFVVDTLIGNTDRFLSDFGFFEDENKLYFAPVYGCGLCLNPLLSDDEIKNYLSNESEFKNITYNIYPVYSYNSRKLTYKEFYNSNIKELNDALLRIYPKIDMNIINSIIDEIPYISDIRKEFYKKSILIRKENILDIAFKKL